MATPMSGSTMGGYRIESQIGRGGMGIVYRATHIALDRQVALKVIAEELAEDEGFRERFRREPKLAASIDHPNVIPVFDAGEASEQLFVAMRYVPGSDLRSLIADEGRLEPQRAARIVAQVGDALDAAHALGLVHRDVKPANVLIEDRNGREHVYLTDFGLTKGGEGSTALTKTGQWVGTPDYVAPEQIHGGTLDRRTDIYALGAVLYHALSGQPPYGRETEVAKIYAHLSRPPPELPDDVDASAALRATIQRAMAKEPADRYSSAGELGRDALAAVGIGAPGPPSVPVSPTVPAAAPGETAAVPGETAPGETAAAPGQTSPAKTAAAPGETAAAPPETVPGDTAELAPKPTVRPPPPPPPPPPPVAAAPPRMLANRRAVAAMAALAIIVFAAAGYLLGSSGDDGGSDPASFSNSASAGTLELRFPGGWERTNQPVAVPKISFDGQINLASTGGADGAGLAAGQVQAGGPKLLPAGFLQLLGSEPSSGDPVKLGKLEALQYLDLQPRGFGGKLTLFTVPTTAGVATIACAAPTGTSQSVTDQCRQIATTLRLSNAQAFPIGPDETYARALNGAIAALNKARSKKLKQARDAKLPDAQATALDDLGRSYGKAAKRLRAARVSPAAQPANDAMVGALGLGEGAYTSMAGAARSDDSGGYDAGRATARVADAQLRRALRKLSALGYNIKAGQEA